jgi:hypothetical protein
MAKKYPSELNTKTVRIGIGAWALLTEISRRAGVTIAEALDLALKGYKPEPEPEPEPAREPRLVPRTQIPMPVFQVETQPTFRVKSQPAIAVNGHKAGVFVVKPKGGVINA